MITKKFVLLWLIDHRKYSNGCSYESSDLPRRKSHASLEPKQINYLSEFFFLMGPPKEHRLHGHVVLWLVYYFLSHCCISHHRFFNGIKVFAEFPTCVTENSAYPGSVIVDCILLLDSGVNVDNSAFHVLFHDLSIDLAISSTI